MFQEQLKQKSTDELIQLALIASDNEDDPGWTAISVLHTRATREVFDAAKTLCESDDATKRTVGIDILAQLGLPIRSFLDETLEIFFQLIDREQDTRVLNSLGVGLGHISPEPRKVSPLLKLKPQQRSCDLCIYSDFNQSFSGLASHTDDLCKSFRWNFSLLNQVDHFNERD